MGNSFSIVREGLTVLEKFNGFMKLLRQLPKKKGILFRVKGILAMKDHAEKIVFHGVMDTLEYGEAGLWEEGEGKISKIVFIGKGLDHQYLRDGFESAFEDAACSLPPC